MIKAIDICCGGGGWACAARGLPIQIVRAYDIWPTACASYRLNHPKTQVIQCDLSAGLPDDPGQIDLVLGGIPCQWLSCARGRNKPKAEEIERERALLSACLGIAHKLKPRWWCFEDVVGLRKELPLGTPFRVYDAHALGYSVQARKRLFVGEFPDIDRAEQPPRPLSAMLDRGPHRICEHGLTCTVVHFGRRRNLSPSKLRVGIGTEDSRLPTILAWSNRHKNTAPLIVDSDGARRELSWREAARLQGFPRDYIFAGQLTAIWRQLANAVQIDLARAILKGMVTADS